MSWAIQEYLMGEFMDMVFSFAFLVGAMVVSLVVVDFIRDRFFRR